MFQIPQWDLWGLFIIIVHLCRNSVTFPLFMNFKRPRHDNISGMAWRKPEWRREYGTFLRLLNNEKEEEDFDFSTNVNEIDTILAHGTNAQLKAKAEEVLNNGNFEAVVVELLSKSAMKFNDSQSAYRLATIYSGGCEGLKKDLKKCFHWYAVSADLGDDVAAQMLKSPAFKLFKRRERARKAVICILCSKQFRNDVVSSRILTHLPIQVWRKIVLLLYKTKEEECWDRIGDGIF